ncbi:MAG: glycosyltransferase family 4 protein [Nitrososphaerota archaeon]
MKILLVDYSELLVKNFLIEAKKSPDFQIDFCNLYPGNIFKDELLENGFNVFDLDLSCKFDFRAVFNLIKLIKENNYDIVHVKLFPADLFCAITSLFVPKSVKFILSKRSIYNKRRSIRLYKPIDIFVYSRYKKIICTSNFVKDRLLKCFPNLDLKTVVIKNGIIVKNELQDFKHKVYDLLFVGTLEFRKGVDTLIKSVDILRRNHSMNLTVAIVGEGPQKNEYKNLVKNLSLEDNVKFLGIRRDVYELIKLSKVFILPSRSENFPTILLEAMANGIPVIASDVGGISEVIKDGIDGLLVKPEDPYELADKIKFAINNSEICEELKINAFEKVKREYSIESYTRKALQLYEEVTLN